MAKKEKNIPKKGGALDLLTRQEQQTSPPKKYKVIFHNDDYTPMDFVIEILQTFFTMSHDRATQVMLHVHTRGTRALV